MRKKYYLNELKSLKIDIKSPSIIFLKGDLGAGKTTLSQHIIGNVLQIEEQVTSPTYTYYNKYVSPSREEVYHFDLYRLSNYDEFFAIGGEEIFDNNTGIILVEWPEILEKYYEADIEIILTKTLDDDEREIEIKTKKNIL